MVIWTAEIKELEKLYESLRDQVPELKNELEKLIKSDDSVVILLYSRRCLEVIITDLCEYELKRPRKTEPLKGIIDKLHKEEKVPSHIIGSMYGLNELSTYGAHPKDFDPEQVKPVLNNLSIIIKWYLKYKSIVALSKPEGEGDKVVSGDELVKEEKKEVRKEVQKKTAKTGKHKLISIVAIGAILIIAVIIVYSKILNRNSLESYRREGKISVAIMPFQNNTIGSKWEKSQEMVQFILKNSLSSNEEIIVRDIESINNMTQEKRVAENASLTLSFAKTISKKLDANVFIVGSIIQAGNKLRLQAELIDSKTGIIFKSFHKEGAAIEENIIQMTDSLQLDIKDFLLISLLGKNIPAFQKKALLTNSPEALKEYIYGDEAFYKRENVSAISHYKNAIAIDSNFLFPMIRICLAYGNENLYAQSKEWASKAIHKVNQMDPFLKNYAYYSYYIAYGRFLEAIKHRKELIKIDDQNPTNYWNIGFQYNRLDQYDNAIPYFVKTLEIFKKMDLRPYWSQHYISLGFAFHKTGQYKKEMRLYKRAEKDFPEDLYLIFRQVVLELSRGKDKTATKYIEKYISLSRENSIAEAEIKTAIANIYWQADLFDKAEEYYRQASSLEPENPVTLNNLAYFLIDKNHNINEGLELTDKALIKSPENHIFLHTKGWGLYKQGKYHEALEILQKSWNLREEMAIYDHEAFLHLEEAKKAVANKKNN